ncbi:MAG TPA: transcriptional activator NhaR [Terriglobales bacterium]|nr:transcriptional activator NhaR [Terriglobales bacterium]
MEWLNYHHLLYFWTVVREGGVSKAAAQLRLAQPTVSSQLRALEEALGEKLFQRTGRRLELTEMGQAVYSYADEIFALGRELMDTVKQRPTARPLALAVGIADIVPKLIIFRLLQPAMNLPQPIRVVCREGKIDRLLGELSVHQLDLVISDAPFPPSLRVKAFNHLLGECGVGFFGASALVKSLRRGFPHSLDGAPLLLPTENTVLRRSLDQWFYGAGVRPRIVGEMEDSALMNSFGQAGIGLFPGPLAISAEIRRQYAVQLLGAAEPVRERYYAISIERRLKHAAVIAISAAARKKLFG